MNDEPTSDDLEEVEREELDTAEHATLPAERDKAERRAEKAGYLADKLAEQEAADEEAG
jgi:hypothetical protein